MAAKLNCLKITSTDLVDQGANPDAYIRLFKRKDESGENTLIKRIFNAVAGVFGKSADDMDLNISEGSNESVKMGGSKEYSINKNEANGNVSNKGINLKQKGEMKTMRIDKSKMTSEEQAVLADFEHRYGMKEQQIPDEGIAKGEQACPELHPEVRKALADFEEFKKAKEKEIEELKKSLEMEKLISIAGKYEVIGKKADELACKLYELKKAGGTVYDDYVALLDENLSMVEKSGLFDEIGKNTSGFAGAVEKIGIAAAEIQKGESGVNSSSAIVKAWEDNPELALEYEREYMGGIK